MSTEVRISNFNQDIIKATYFAEAGIEEVFNLINNDHTISAFELKEVSGYIKNGIPSYEIISAITPDDENSDSNNFIITALGRKGNVKKKITVIISLIVEEGIQKPSIVGWEE